jgi:hypothetical protein
MSRITAQLNQAERVVVEEMKAELDLLSDEELIKRDLRDLAFRLHVATDRVFTPRRPAVKKQELRDPGPSALRPAERDGPTEAAQGRPGEAGVLSRPPDAAGGGDLGGVAATPQARRAALRRIIRRAATGVAAPDGDPIEGPGLVDPQDDETGRE